MLDPTCPSDGGEPTTGVHHNQLAHRTPTPLRVEGARTKVRTEIRAFFRAHGATLDESSRANAAFVWALRITTGVGKSTICAAEAAAAFRNWGVPILILTPTRELAARYVEQIREAGCTDVQLYQSRQSVDAVARDPALQPWRCWKLDAVRAAGERNHLPAQSLCRECPHGRVSEFRCGDVRRERVAQQWIRVNDVDIDSTPGCDFLYDGLPRVKAAGIIVAPAEAFSEALAYYYPRCAPGEQPRKLRRAVVIDEAISLGRLVRVGLADLEQWITRVTDLRAYALEKVARGYDDRDWRAVIMLCESGDSIFRGMAAALALRQAPNTNLLAALAKEAAHADMMGAGIASWERIAYVDEQHFAMPLRALRGLAHSARSGTLRTTSTGVEFFESAAVLDWARERGGALFMDATLPMTMQTIIASWGGRIVDAVAQQNLLLTRITGCRYARGEPRKSGYRRTAEAYMRDYQIVAENHARVGGQWAVLVHMAHVVHGAGNGYDPKSQTKKCDVAAQHAAEFERETGVPLGWWGRHHRGHDGWKGRHMAIFGQPILGYERADDGVESGSMAEQWRLARAAAITAGCSADDWPADIGEMAAGSDGLPLPIDPRVRRWLIDLHASDLIQAIGRARAAGCPHRIRIELWGGVDAAEIDAVLLAHGLTVQETWPNEIHMTRCGRPQGLTGDVLARAVRSIRDALIAEGRRVTVRAVSVRLRARGERACQSGIAKALQALKIA